MSPVNGEAAAATWGGGRADLVTGLRRWILERRASLLVFAAAAVISSLRILAWPSALRQDQWAYTLVGQALAHLHRPVLIARYATTTPKPLTTLLALVASPLPPERAFAAVSILATAVLASATFAYGRRVGGPLGAVAAVAALVLLPTLPQAMYGGEIDLVGAALVVLALVSGPRARVVLMILVGLLRPATWPLAGIAAFLAARGSLRRRLALGVLGTAAPAVIWAVTDAVLYGSALASYRANDRINRHVVAEPFVGALERVVRGVGHGTGPVLFGIGLAGLAVALARRPWRGDPFPGLVFAGYVAVLVVTWMRMRYNDRYALPLVALWPLATAYLAAPIRLPARLRSATIPAAVCAIAILAAGAAHMSMDPSGLRRAQLTNLTLDSVPAVRRALACGPVGVEWPYVSAELTVATDASIRDFRSPLPGVGATPSEVIRTGSRQLQPRIRALKSGGWTSELIPLGRLWISPGCRAG
jgi:hypothetical protein